MAVPSAAIPGACAKLLAPNWRTHATSPFVPTRAANTSTPPELVVPGNEPSVLPATYAPVASTAIPVACSKPLVPNWRTHATSPFVPTRAANTSDPPELVAPGNDPKGAHAPGEPAGLSWTGTPHRFLHGCPPPAYAVHCVIVVAAESRATTDVLEMLAAEVVEVMAAGLAARPWALLSGEICG